MARGINTINGVDYVYEYKSQWNAKRHRSEQKRDYIGKIKDGKFVPNKLYRMRLELETLKRQNGLPSDSAEMPLEDEIELIYQKHEAHKAKLAEMKNEEKPVKKASRKSKAEPAEEEKTVTVEEETIPVETPAAEPAAETLVEEAIEAVETPSAEPEVEKKPRKKTSRKSKAEPAEEEKTVPVEEDTAFIVPESAIEENTSVETPSAEAEPAVETLVVEEVIDAVETPSAEPEVEEKPRKHVLREGELDDEEYGPDLFNVQPSVAPVEDEPEEEVPVVEEEDEEDPDLFSFAEDVEMLVADEEPSAEADIVDETAVEVETVEEVLPVEEPIEEEIPEVKEEPRKKGRAAKTRKEKKEEDNGQLFLF